MLESVFVFRWERRYLGALIPVVSGGVSRDIVAPGAAPCRAERVEASES